jgi:TolA-binding protein
MNTNILVVFILTLTLGMSYLYTSLREFYSPTKDLRHQVAALDEKVKTERFKHLVDSYEFAEFRNYVATILPEAIKEKGDGEKSFQLRSLASVVQNQSNENLAVEQAQMAFDTAKKYFREQKFEDSNRLFALMIKSHPYSAHVPEAMFLMVEGYFQLHQYDQALTAANKMIEVYPDNELTGYAMVRLGKIYEYQDRHEEAMDIYKTVIKSFPQRSLASVAENALRSEQL